MFYNVNFEYIHQNLFQEHKSYLDDVNNSLSKALSIPPNIFTLPNVHIVNFKGVFLRRLKKYNEFISDFRSKLLKQRRISSWNDIQPESKLKAIYGYSENFFEKLANIPSIELVVLPWLPGEVSSNLVHTDYFKWTGTDELCKYFEKAGLMQQRWDSAYNRSCNRKSIASQNASELETMYLYSKPIGPKHYWPNNGNSYPYHYYHQPPFHTLYLTILHDAVVNFMGALLSDNFKIILYTCLHSSSIPKSYRNAPFYTEVFAVSQKWGDAFFHRMAEVLPRIAPYISFLKQNPSIYIHALEKGGKTALMLEILGLSSKRLVTGTIRAKLVYIPQGTPCGYPQVAPSQVLSHVFKQFIHNKIPPEVVQKVENVSKIQQKQFQGIDYPFYILPPSTKSPATPLPPLEHTTPRNRLVLIERSGYRKFLHKDQILNAVVKFSTEHHLDFFYFHDRPVQDLLSTMLIFNSALIIVAPHGGGLVNCLYSQPGTLVVEGVCNRPITNMCYQFLAYATALRYHGIASKSGCEGYINISADEIIGVLNQYVSILKLGTSMKN